MERSFKKKLEEKIVHERSARESFEQTLELHFWQVFGEAVDRIDDVDDICQEHGEREAVCRSELYIVGDRAIVTTNFFEHSGAAFTVQLIAGFNQCEIKLCVGRNDAKTYRVVSNPTKSNDLEPAGVTELVQNILEERVPAGFLHLTDF